MRICGSKRRFPTWTAADDALGVIWGNAHDTRGPGPLPSRVYPCQCGSFHLTATPRDPLHPVPGEVLSETAANPAR